MKTKTLIATTILASSLLIGGHSLHQGGEKTLPSLMYKAEIPKRDNPPNNQFKTAYGAYKRLQAQAQHYYQQSNKHTFTIGKSQHEIKEERKRNKPNYTELTVEATAYVSFCDTGCIGTTKRGTPVTNNIYHTSGLKIIAVDPAVIPLGSIVEINGEKYIADDTGGDIKGNRIDILIAVHNTAPAFEFGRKTLKVKVYD